MLFCVVRPLTVAILALAARLAFAGAPGASPSTAAKPEGTAKAGVGHPAKKAPRRKLVDLNSATKEQLKKLPGITDELAAKIISGRPYMTKAHLVTHNILSSDLYWPIKDRVAAIQPKAARK